MEVFRTLDEMVERSKTSPLWTLAASERLSVSNFAARYELYDLVDGYYILRPIVQFSRGTTRVRALLDTSVTLPVEVFGGDASVERDSLNGNILIRPRGDETVHARPSVVTSLGGTPVKLAGTDIEIGISPESLGPGENVMSVAGGGSCAADVVLPTSEVSVNVQVRASIAATAMPKTLTRREVAWRNGRYFAHDPVIGLISLYYDPDRTSRSIIETNNANFATTLADFFPARTQNYFHFMCDFVDLGITTFSKVPMRQTLAAANWPPFATAPINIDEPVEFYDVRDPNRLVMRIKSQNMYLYDYNSIDVDLVSHRFDGDVLTMTWEIRNQSDAVIFGRWFMLGDFQHDPARPDQGNRMLGPSGTPGAVIQIDVAIKVTPSVLQQSVTMNVVSLRDPILAGNSALQFQHSG